MCNAKIPGLILHLKSYTLCYEIQKTGKHSLILCKNFHQSIDQNQFIL